MAKRGIVLGSQSTQDKAHVGTDERVEPGHKPRPGARPCQVVGTQLGACQVEVRSNEPYVFCDVSGYTDGSHQYRSGAPTGPSEGSASPRNPSPFEIDAGCLSTGRPSASSRCCPCSVGCHRKFGSNEVSLCPTRLRYAYASLTGVLTRSRSESRWVDPMGSG